MNNNMGTVASGINKFYSKRKKKFKRKIFWGKIYVFLGGNLGFPGKTGILGKSWFFPGKTEWMNNNFEQTDTVAINFWV